MDNKNKQIRKITIDELRKLSDLLLGRVQNVEGNDVVIDEDYYLMIDSSERQNFYTEHPKFSTGSLFDDVETLKKVTEDKYAASTIALERLGQIFLYLGAKIRKNEQGNAWKFSVTPEALEKDNKND
jgi:hypothetical protein